MYWYWVGAGVLVCGSSAAFGVVAIVGGGWMLPWLRRRTRRPRLWGFGAVCSSAGLPVCYLSFNVWSGSEIALFASAVAGMALMFTGSVLVTLAGRSAPAQP
jgi:hypothetical protein